MFKTKINEGKYIEWTISLLQNFLKSTNFVTHLEIAIRYEEIKKLQKNSKLYMRLCK